MNVFFTGRAGSGKSYCAKFLIEKYGYIPAKMAYPVYEIARNYFNMTNKDRYLLQLIGTDIGRDLVNPNIWADRFYQDLFIVEETAKKLNKKVLLVSDDVRFPNELKMLKDLGWKGINLVVPEEIRLSRLVSRDGDAQAEHLEHISETAIDHLVHDLVQLDSSASLEITYQKLEETLEFLRRDSNEQVSRS